MYNFFVKKNDINGEIVRIYGGDFNHIANVLRFKEGDEFLVSVDKSNNLCRLIGFENDCVVAEIIEKDYMDTSLPIEIYLFL